MIYECKCGFKVDDNTGGEWLHCPHCLQPLGEGKPSPTIEELRRDKQRLDWLENSTDGCQNSIVLVHNYDRYGSCRATIDHALDAAQKGK